MDENKIIPIAAVQPRVRIANRHPVGRGMVWGPRRNIDPQLILLLSGALTYHGPDGATEVSPGQVLLIPAGHRHRLEAGRDGELAGLHGEFASGSWAAGDYLLDPAPPLLSSGFDLTAVQALFGLAAETFAGYRPWRQELLDGLCRDLLLLLAGTWRGDAVAAPGGGRMATMIACIRERLPAATDRQDLARRFGLTPEYVNALFRRELGMTPGAVLNRERCLLAHGRLLAGASVQEAAAAAGYQDPFYFSRIYRRLFGVAPSTVRGTN